MCIRDRNQSNQFIFTFHAIISTSLSHKLCPSYLQHDPVSKAPALRPSSIDSSKQGDYRVTTIRARGGRVLRSAPRTIQVNSSPDRCHNFLYMTPMSLFLMYYTDVKIILVCDIGVVIYRVRHRCCNLLYAINPRRNFLHTSPVA